MGIGSMGGGTQMLFGSSGGQDIFQKITWVLGTIFMLGSMGLALLKTASAYQLRYAPTREPVQEQPVGQMIKESSEQTTKPQSTAVPADTDKAQPPQ